MNLFSFVKVKLKLCVQSFCYTIPGVVISLFGVLSNRGVYFMMQKYKLKIKIALGFKLSAFSQSFCQPVTTQNSISDVIFDILTIYSAKSILAQTLINSCS